MSIPDKIPNLEPTQRFPPTVYTPDHPRRPGVAYGGRARQFGHFPRLCFPPTFTISFVVGRGSRRLGVCAEKEVKM
jgi:hypothetical protein